MHMDWCLELHASATRVFGSSSCLKCSDFPTCCLLALLLVIGSRLAGLEIRCSVINTL